MTACGDFERMLAGQFSVAGELAAEHLERLWRHYELLCRWNRVLNLTRVLTVEDAVVRHYCESLFVALHLPPEPVSVLDIGSGAGFPGVPMAVFRPDCHFTLAESHRRKAAFLREATRDLPNVVIAARRAETLTASFDWVVSRAVGWSELRRCVGRLGRSVALLLGRADAEKVRGSPGFVWQAPVALPWSERSVLLHGTVCST